MVGVVDHDQAPQVPQNQDRVVEQPVVIGGMLQVQVVRTAGVRPGHLPCQRGLADLTRPENGDDGECPQPLPNDAHVAGPLDQSPRYHEISTICVKISW